MEEGGVSLGSIISFSVYLVSLLGVGFAASRFGSKGVAEFFLGGRQMPSWVVALSAVVSGRSAWLLLGLTGMAYQRGLTAVWAVTGYILVEMLMLGTMAKRLRRLTGRMDNVTLPDFLESRFEDRSGALRITSVTIMLLFMVVYIAGQVNAGGKTFTSGFEIPLWLGIAITAGVIMVYTVSGGYVAVAINDSIQALLILATLIYLPTVGLWGIGGYGGLTDTLVGLDPALFDPFALAFGGYVAFLGIGLGSPGNPHILVRFMSVSDPRMLRRSMLIGTIANVVMAWGAIHVGLIARAMFPEASLLPDGDPDHAFPFVASRLLPSAVFGIAIAAVFAAILSTADSQLLVASSGLVRDIYQRLIRRGQEVSQRRLVMLSRIVVVMLLALATVLSFFVDSIFWFVLLAWGGLGAAFGPPIVLSLYWRRITRTGALVGMISGATSAVVWSQIPELREQVREYVAAFLISLVCTVVVSLFTRPPKGVDALMDAMKPSDSEL